MSYRVGIIGCGGMGRSHAGEWSRRADVEVVAVADIEAEAVQRLAQEYEVPATYTDYEEMLQQEELDIVSIPTWQGVRAPATVAAARAVDAKALVTAGVFTFAAVGKTFEAAHGLFPGGGEGSKDPRVPPRPAVLARGAAFSKKRAAYRKPTKRAVDLELRVFGHAGFSGGARFARGHPCCAELAIPVCP